MGDNRNTSAPNTQAFAEEFKFRRDTPSTITWAVNVPYALYHLKEAGHFDPMVFKTEERSFGMQEPIETTQGV